MANITVLRISLTKKIKKPVLQPFFWFGFLLAIVLIYIAFFFDSVKYLESESVRVVRTTNLKNLEKVIFYSMPVLNFDSNKSIQKDNGYLGIFNFKKILQEKYPVLSLYVPDLNTNDNDYVSDSNKKSNEKNENEDNENKNSKIYSKTTLLKSKSIIIRNHTKYKADINKMLSDSLDFQLSKKGTSIIILHTHTTEAYMSENKSNTNTDDGYRTTSPNRNVTRVGLELKKQLDVYKIKAIQDTTMHDYPEYLGAYSRSLKSTLNDLKKHPEANAVFDIHRDAYGETEGNLRVATKINGSDAAKIMFVVGTDELGLEHKDWRENLKLAVKLQENANKIYPGLCREIDLRKERFNQHSAPGAIIIEVGGTGNTVVEAERSMKYLARVIAETFKTK